MNYKNHREYVERFIKHARRTAWGEENGISNIPGLGAGGQSNDSTPRSQTPDNSEESMQWNRKQKRAMERDKKKGGANGAAKHSNPRLAEKAKAEGVSTPVEAEITSGPVGAKKRTVAENGKILIVDSVGNVYLEEHTEEGATHEFLLDVSEHH
jgi:hypothetical protein